MFDSVNHRRILETLGKRGVPRKFLRTVASLYQANTTTMSDGKLIRIKRGVVLGDPLSPTLFNLILNEALKSALSPFNKVYLMNGEEVSAVHLLKQGTSDEMYVATKPVIRVADS